MFFFLIAGSPGNLSPVSTMSNGPAPTIPSAPMSPRGLDGFDFDQPFSFDTLPAQRPASTSLLQQQPHSYHGEREYRPSSTGYPSSGGYSSSQGPARYGSLDRQTASYGLPNGMGPGDPFESSPNPYNDLLAIGKPGGDYPRGRTSPYLTRDNMRSPSPYTQHQDSGMRAPSPATAKPQRAPANSYGYGGETQPRRISATEEPKYPL